MLFILAVLVYTHTYHELLIQFFLKMYRTFYVYKCLTTSSSEALTSAESRDLLAWKLLNKGTDTLLLVS